MFRYKARMSAEDRAGVDKAIKDGSAAGETVRNTRLVALVQLLHAQGQPLAAGGVQLLRSHARRELGVAVDSEGHVEGFAAVGLGVVLNVLALQAGAGSGRLRGGGRRHPQRGAEKLPRAPVQSLRDKG